MLTFEDLPNELLLLVFNYLSGVDIVWSFYSLNRRFSVLIEAIKDLNIDFSNQPLSKSQFVYIVSQFRSLNIQSLKICNRYCADAIPLLISRTLSAQLIHLRSLTLINSDRSTITKLVRNYPQLTSISIESPAWRSLPRRLLPYLSNISYCHIPTLDLLNGSSTTITTLVLDHCSTADLIQLNNYVPNLKDLTMTLENHVEVSQNASASFHLNSLKLVLKSVLFDSFERFLMMFKRISNLTISFTNTEYGILCFDQYLFGEYWYMINQNVDNLQFNIIVYRAQETYSIPNLVASFHWFQRKIICQRIDNLNSYHLFSLPFIDTLYSINAVNVQSMIENRHDFLNVNHLHLTFPNEHILPCSNTSFNFICSNLRTLTVIAYRIDETIITAMNNLIHSIHLQTLELRFSSKINQAQIYFDRIISQSSSSIHTLRLNTTCTKLLADLLNRNNQLLFNIKRLMCSVKSRDHFDVLVLLLLEIFSGKSLVYLNISLENATNSSNLLSGWLMNTSQIKKSTIKCSDRQCSIWFL